MPLAPGTRLGPYEVDGLLGAGGMGEVYRAKDARLGRSVAIKVLPAAVADSEDRLRRFEQEARAASALNHPNILAIYDIGRHDGVSYVVSELLEGTTLRDRLPLSWRKALDCAVQTARGLAAAHAKGIVHRDLKPENLFITTEGGVKILDFGLAKFTPALSTTDETGTMPSRETEPGTVMGTTGYMSPEQVRGQRVDHRSDLFSFGAILYEMISGRRAFDRETAAETMTAILKDDPSELPVSVTPGLERIVRRCLEKNVDERFQSARDLAFALDALSASGPSRVEGVSIPARGGRRPVPWLALLAAGATLAAPLLLWRLARLPRSPDLAAYRFTPLATDAGYEGVPSWSPDGTTIAYLGEASGVLQVFTRSLASSMPAQITRAARDCHDPFWARDGARIYYISQAGNTESLWSIGATGGTPELALKNVDAATLSPDGKSLFVLREDNYQGNFLQSLWVSSPPGSEPKHYAEAPFAQKRFARGFLRVSPDGAKLALWGASTADEAAQERGYANPELWIIPLAGGAPRQILKSILRLPDPSPFSWLPDSSHVVFGAEFRDRTPGTHLWIADTESGSLMPITATSGAEQYPAASPDGSKIAFTVQQEDYDLIEVPLDGSPARSMLATSRSEADPAWAPSGNLHVYVTDRTGSPEIWLRSRDGSIERPLVTQQNFKDETFLLSGPVFSPDGQRIAYQRRGGSGFRVWLSGVAGGPAVQLAANDAYQDSPTWSPDGNWIAFTSLRQGKWGLAKGKAGGAEAPLRVKEGIIYPSDPQWSPRGDWITCDLPEGFAIVSPDGQKTRVLSEETWLTHGWSKDGATIYAVRHSDELRLQLVAIDVASGGERILAKDLGPSPPSDDPLKGFSLAPDGKSFLTSILRLRGDVWLLEGFGTQGGLGERLWPRTDR